MLLVRFHFVLLQNMRVQCFGILSLRVRHVCYSAENPSDMYDVWCLQDMGELEEAVAANLWPLETLGNPHRVYQGFRRLLSLETSELKDSPLLGGLPPLVVTHHLFCRAPSALQSPHTRAGFTPQQVPLLILVHSWRR